MSRILDFANKIGTQITESTNRFVFFAVWVLYFICVLVPVFCVLIVNTMFTNQQPKNRLDKDTVTATVKKMVGFMNIDCQIEAKEELGDNYGYGAIVVSIQTPNNARFLIGKNGQNLKALEHVLRAMLIKPDNFSPGEDSNKAGTVSGGGAREGTIILDVNDYRKSRASYLVDVAKQAVARVRNTQKAEALFPMSAYERRIVHMELAAYPDIATESIGSDPNRRVVIKLFQQLL